MSKNKRIDKNDKTVLFDIDFTLFDTGKFDSRMTEKFIEISGMSEEDYMIMQAGYLSYIGEVRRFKHSELIDLVSQKSGVAKEEFFKEVRNTENYKDCVFKDVRPTFKKLKQMGVHLGIFSEGALFLQLQKLLALDLSDYLDPDLVYMAEDKARIEFLSTLKEGSYVVDDVVTKVELIRDAEELNLRPVFLSRMKSNVVEGVPRIWSLMEIVDIVK